MARWKRNWLLCLNSLHSVLTNGFVYHLKRLSQHHSFQLWFFSSLLAPPHYNIQTIRIKVVRNSVSLVFGMLVWHLRMLSQRLQWRCKRSVWGSHLLKETKLWWPISKKVKKAKVLYVFLKFKKSWHNLSMKWCNRLSFINYLFRYISTPLKLKGIKFYNFARPIKRTVMSQRPINQANTTPPTASVTSSLRGD